MSGRPELTISAWLRFDSISRALAIAGPSRVLEIGAGEGALGAWLAGRFAYIGVEPDDAARRVAGGRLAGARRGVMLPKLAADAGSFDTVCAFEVLEHIEDDAAALTSWRARLRPGGYLLISVPAHSTRFGVSDRYVGHFRRYDRGTLQTVLTAAGFEVIRWDSYGAGLGHVLDAVRNALLAGRVRNTTAAEGTALSGRLFQPTNSGRAFINYVIALPFRVLQRPFRSTDIGIGYVVLARAR